MKNYLDQLSLNNPNYKISLHKLSHPGWSLNFDNMLSLTEKLRKHICRTCIDEYGSDLHGMMNSCCGCEFLVEDPIETTPPTCFEVFEDTSYIEHRKECLIKSEVLWQL